MTQFEQAKKQVQEGTLKAPSVSMGNRQIPYFRFQLNTHKFNLKIMSSGMKFRGVKLKDIKAYYGLTGKSAKDCLPQLEKIIADYEAEMVTSN